jgi:hypothetical protein
MLKNSNDKSRANLQKKGSSLMAAFLEVEMLNSVKVHGKTYATAVRRL